MADKDCTECGGEGTLEGRALNMWKRTITYICKNEDCLHEEEHPV